MKKTMMRMLLQFLLVLLGALTILVSVQAQDQSGFISLDCGLPVDSTYSSAKTGINYISDAKFIDTDTGVSMKNIITPTGHHTLLQELEYVRSFPKGVRNCYKINVTSGTKYLIRVSFFYGNYDNLNKLPQFDLHLGANLWDTVKLISNEKSPYEIIYTPSLDYIQPCLVNTGNGTPFISAIELRPLNNKAYVSYSAKSVLSPVARLDFGSINKGLIYRYKDDVYDRIWSPFKLLNDQKQLSTSLNNDDLENNDYNIPAILMSTAVTPVNARAPLHFRWDAHNLSDQYELYMHFNEVVELAATEIREFNIIVNNGELFSRPVIPAYRNVTTIVSRIPLTGEKGYNISLSKTGMSTLPPILNAIEIYKVKDFSQSETQQDDVDAITNIKNAYGVTRNWQGDPCSPVNYMWEGLNCSVDNNNIPRITSLDLSSSGLTGQIASSISKLAMLQYLDLSNNELNGHLPDFLVQLHSLKVLNVSRNNITGLVPSELLQRSKTGSLSLSVDSLCIKGSCRKKKLVVPLTVLFLVLIVIILIFLGFWIFRRQKAVITSSNSKKNGSIKSKHQTFSYTEILSITDNFKTIIGKGGFGKVYLGTLQDQTQVAIKVLSPSSKQGYKEFQSEAELLMIVHHRNLVPLIGYCDEDENKALVYEYMVNGNLEQHLFAENSSILKWNKRLEIAIDTAHGLDYLHNGCKPPIIHRDLKPSNILLDDSMHAKIADFGLSRAFANDVDSHISTQNLAGTFGYFDPECHRTGKTNKANDIYSFGIILFVLITGRQAIETTVEDKIHILKWVKPLFEEGDIQNIVDPRLEGEFNINSAWKVVDIAMSCISQSADERPGINQILIELKECLSSEIAQIGNSGSAENTIRSSETTPLTR